MVNWSSIFVNFYVKSSVCYFITVVVSPLWANMMQHGSEKGKEKLPKPKEVAMKLLHW